MQDVSASTEPTLIDTTNSSDSYTISPRHYSWLFIFHASSLWVERMFDFAVAIFISKIYSGTFLQTSLYGLAITAAPIILSSFVGSLIDTSMKIIAVRIALFIQKVAIIFSFISLIILDLQKQDSDVLTDFHYYLFYCLLITGAIMRLSTVGIKIGIERHWLAVLAKTDSGLLSSLNAILRRIDLLCGFFVPMFVSTISDLNTIYLTSICLITLTVGSFFVEIYSVTSLYKQFPVLVEMDSPANIRSLNVSPVAMFQNLAFFARHPLFLTSLSLSLLFCNVLSFGGTMIAYFKTVNFSDKQVALVSGACTLTGIVGTFISPHLVKRIGLRWAGNAFLSQEVFYLALVVLAIHLVPVHSVAFYLALLVGTILARAGLCGFDLVQTQMIQEGVNFEQLGSYVGFQFGLQNAFELGQYGLTTFWSDPDDFKYPATMSLFIVGMSLVIFFCHGYLKPAHNNSSFL